MRIMYRFFILSCALVSGISSATSTDARKHEKYDLDETIAQEYHIAISILSGDDLILVKKNFAEAQKLAAAMHATYSSDALTVVDKIDNFLHLAHRYVKFMRTLVPTDKRFPTPGALSSLGLCGKPLYVELDAFMHFLNETAPMFCKKWRTVQEIVRETDGLRNFDDIIEVLMTREAIARFHVAVTTDKNLGHFLGPYVLGKFGSTMALVDAIASAKWSGIAEDLLYTFTRQAHLKLIMQLSTDERRVDEKRELYHRFHQLLERTHAIAPYDGATLNNLSAIFEVFMAVLNSSSEELSDHASSMTQLQVKPTHASSSAQRRKKRTNSPATARFIRQGIADDLFARANEIWHLAHAKFSPHIAEKLTSTFEQCRELHHLIMANGGMPSTPSATPPLIALQQSLERLRQLKNELLIEQRSFEKAERQKARAEYYARIAAEPSVTFDCSTTTNLRGQYGFTKPSFEPAPSIATTGETAEPIEVPVAPAFTVNWLITKHAKGQYERLPAEFLDKFADFVAEIEENPWSHGLGKAKLLATTHNVFSRRFDRVNRFVIEVNTVSEGVVDVRILSFLGHYKNLDLSQKATSSSSASSTSKAHKKKQYRTRWTKKHK